MEWKWTPTEKQPYEKTSRYVKREEPVQMEKPPDFENLAHSYSLNSPESMGWESDSFLENNFKIENKREDAYSKIVHNQFLDSNDYVKNIAARDMFLKPINTNSDREKKKDFEE
jgi:hypothetical protein